MEDEPPLKQCDYCCKDISEEKWSSTWSDEKHYKVLECGCGKKNWMSTDFVCSGHDSTIKGRLESIVRKVCDIGCSR